MTSSGRQQPSLADPPPRDTLAAFPNVVLGTGDLLIRITRVDRDPWWFGSGGDGRFDLRSPEGTCYLCNSVVGALLEVLGGALAVLDPAWLAGRQVHELTVPEPAALADLTDRRSRSFGVTGEIHTLVPYHQPQRWAWALRGGGFDGLRYRVRHDPSGRGIGVALFGPEGLRESWPAGRVQPCDAPTIVQMLQQQTGLQLATRPRLDQLVVED